AFSLSTRCFYAYSVTHSFPTRRSSDLTGSHPRAPGPAALCVGHPPHLAAGRSRRARALCLRGAVRGQLCRPGRGLSGRHALGTRSEEQRLNSSHVKISYAVFCLKKKKE